MKKKLVSCILVVCMLLTMLPTMAWAEEASPTDVPAGTLYIDDGSIVITDTGYTQGDVATPTDFTGDYVIKQRDAATATANTITVNGIANGKTVTLSGVNIKSPEYVAPFDANASVKVLLIGNNTLYASGGNNDNSKAGLDIASGCTVTLAVPEGYTDVEGKLVAKAHERRAAGIGGGNSADAGALIIESGTIEAACRAAGGGNANASGIGAGRNKTMESITIKGGVVSVAGSKQVMAFGYGATTVMIEGGNVAAYSFNKETLTVTGGNLSATSDSGLPETDKDGRELTKIVFTEEYAGKEVLVSEVNGEFADTSNYWSALVSNDGLITTYLHANTTKIYFKLNSAESTVEEATVSDGLAIMGEPCTCGTAGTIKWSAELADMMLYKDMAKSKQKTITASYAKAESCAAVIHPNLEDVTVTMTVKDADGNPVTTNAGDYANYPANGKLQMFKPVGVEKYTVTLTADNGAGVSDEQSMTVTIKDDTRAGDIQWTTELGNVTLYEGVDEIVTPISAKYVVAEVVADGYKTVNVAMTVKDKNGTKITSGADAYATYVDGILTLKRQSEVYTVELKAETANGEVSKTQVVKVTSMEEKGLDVANGPIVVSAVEGTDEVKYTQGGNSFTVEKDTPVTISGTYSAAATPIIDITGGTPNIVLSDLNIKNTNGDMDVDSALRVTTGVATITLEGENTIATGTSRSSIKVESGAKLIIDSAAGTVGLDSVVDKFKNDHNVTIEQTKYAGTLNMGTIVGPGDVIIKGGNIVSDVNGYAFYSISNLEITGGNIYVVRNRPDSVWADNLTITSGTVFAKVVNTSDKTGENYDTSYRTAISGNTLTLGTEGDDANAKKLYIYADNSKCNGAAIGGHYDCTVNIHSGVIIADASGNGNACAIGIGNASDKDDTPVANINITGGDISAIGPEPYVVDNGDGTSYVQMVTSIGSRGNSQSNSGGVNGQGVISITGGTISTNGTIGTSMCNQDRDAVRNGEMTVEEAKALFAGSSLTISGDATVKQTSDIAPATIAQGYYDTAISGDASVAGVELPEGVDSVTFSANAPWNLKANTDGTVTLPEGTTVTKDDGSSVELSNKATMAADGTIATSGAATITKEDGSSVTLSNGGTIAADGTITAGGTVTTKDSDGNVVSTVVVPEDKTATVDADGKVTAPAGTKVTVGDKETTLTNGGTVSADGTVKKNYVGGGYYTPPVSADVDNSSLNNAAQAVGSAINNGSAEMKPATGYTKEEIAKLQKEGKLNLTIEKKSGYASVADKNLIDAAIAKAGGAVSGTSVLYFDITPVLKTDDGKVVATVTDTEKPLTITLDLSAELQKAAKDGKHIAVVRCHEGKATFIDGKLNAAKTKITFSSSDFSTYAVVALDKQASAQTFDAGIVVYAGMAVLAATGSAVVIGKKRRAE